MRAINGVVLSLGIAAIAFAGCGKDKKKEGEEAAAGGEAAGGEAAGAARPAAGGGGAALAYMPKDAQIVAGVNLNALRGTKLWDQFMPMLQQNAGEDLKEFQTACGLDPFTVVESVTIGGQQSDEDKMVVAIKSSADKAKIIDCAKKIAAKEGEQLTVTEEGDLVKFTDGADETMWFGFKDGLIITGGGAEKEEGKAWLQGVLAGGESVQANPDMMALIKSTDTSTAIWLAMIPPEGDPSMSGFPGGTPPKSMQGSIGFKDGLHVAAAMTYAEAANAKALADQANAMIGPMGSDPQMGKYVQKLKITPEGSVVRLQLDLNQAEFDELLAQIQQQLPMLMMMMGGGAGGAGGGM